MQFASYSKKKESFNCKQVLVIINMESYFDVYSEGIIVGMYLFDVLD